MSTNLPPKHSTPVTSMTKGDLAEAWRFSRWFSSLWSTKLSEFLNCDIRKVLTLQKSYTGDYYKNIICLSFRAYLTKNGFKVLEEYSLNHDDYSAATKGEIEIAQGKYEQVTIGGLTFIEKDGCKYMVSMGEGYRNQTWDLSISYDNKDHDKIKGFIKALETHAKEQNYLQGAKIDPSLSFIKLNKKYTWDDIVLPKVLKDEIQLNTVKLVESIKFYRDNNIPFKRGLILEGAPGTGKTLIGRILCSTINCSFLWVTPKYLTDSGAIASICELARQISPCVLFLEDLDLYAQDRDKVRDSNMLGELMNQLDGLVENNYIIVVATTNKVDFIEEAMRNRPGRFDRTIEIVAPSKEGIKRLLTLCLQRLSTTGDFLDEVAEKAKGFTGAHVQELVNTAVMIAIENKSVDAEGKVILKKEFLLDNIKKVKNKKFEPTLGFDGKSNMGNDDEAEPVSWDDVFE